MRKEAIFCGSLVISLVDAQYFQHYSLYMFHPQMINAGAMASYEDINALLLHKTQWTDFDGAPRINFVDVNVSVSKIKSVFGAEFFQDKIGVHNYNQITIRYAYRLLASSESFLGFGTGLSFRFIKSTYTAVKTYEEHDPQFAQNLASKVGINLPVGIYYYTEKFYLGLSVPHLLYNQELVDSVSSSVRNKFDVSLLHYHLFTGFNIVLSPNVDMYPSLLIKAVSGAPLQIDLAMRLFYQKIMGFGILFRTRSELGFILNYKMNDYFHIIYAYNYNFNKLSEVGSSSHEIGFIVTIPSQRGRIRIDLPRFF